jgi:hypothetical protein
MRTHVGGIPCLASVVIVDGCRGPAQHCDSDLDYYGYVELEIYDTSGRVAPWLERKLTDEDRARIEQEARACMRPR